MRYLCIAITSGYIAQTPQIRPLLIIDFYRIKNVIMTRFIYVLLICLLGILSTATAQMQVSFDDASGDTGTQVSIDVTSENFPALVLFQFSVNWDSTVMRINSITNVTSMLPTYSAGGSFGLPGGASLDVTAGQLSTSWDHPSFTATTVPAGEVLFTMVFDLVGSPGSSTTVVISDEPSDREAVIDDFATDVGVNANTGTVTINGMSTGGDDLTVTIADEIANPGDQVCVAFSVENFVDIESIQFTIEWDESIIEYASIQSFGLPGLDIFDFNLASTATGTAAFFWSDDDGNLNTLTDGDVLFEVCFDAIGTLGQTSTVSIVGTPVAIEFFGNGETYTTGNGLVIDQGSVSIQTVAADAPGFAVGMVNGAVGDTVCVPVSVTNFTDIVSFKHSVTWNSSHLRLIRVDNRTLPGLTPSDFAPIGNVQLNVVWDASDNVTFPNGPIYEVCFVVLGPCVEGTTRNINIGQGGIPAEVGRIDPGGNPVEVNGVDYSTGSVTCTEEVNCPMITPVAADCGDGQGDLFVSAVTGFDSGCECRWTGAATQTTTVGQGCNFLNVPAGSYTLTIVCDGVVECTLSATVAAAPQILVNGNVVDAGCGSLGSITALPSGGTMPYSFMWSGGETTPTITGLQAGPYSVVVTDAAGCSNSRSFQVMDDVADLVFGTPTVTDVTCNGGSDGAVTVVVSGGCTPYMYQWTGSASTTGTATGLSAGAVSVTVTDDAGTTISTSFTIMQPSAISIAAVSILDACAGVADGSISVSATGGAGGYTYAWTPAGTGAVLNGLVADDYMVTATDSDGCTSSATFTVEMRDPAECDGSCPTVNGFVTSDYNGFGVSCNGDNNGSIDFNVVSGMYPLTFSLSGASTASITVPQSGPFGFDDLPAGVYTITSTDGNNQMCTVNTVTLTEPGPLTISNVTVGNVNSGCDGFIDYSLNGAVGDVMCFVNGVLEQDCEFSNLCPGMYVISFIDANGCEVERMERVRDIIGPDGPCYESNEVMTPNGDGANDLFRVTCIDDFPTRLLVFNRWGSLVFEDQVYDGTWDGVDSNGNELPESAYMYVLNVDFGQGRFEVFKGTVTILR